MKLGVPLFVKVMAPLVAVIVLTVGVSGYRVYQASTQRWQADLDTRMERIARIVASTVSTGTLEQIQTPIDIDSDAYARIRQQLEQARSAGSISWVGIYRQRGGYVEYWVDADSTGVGYPFFYVTAEHLAAFQDGQPRRVHYEDEFGQYDGYVAPVVVQDERGEHTLALVEASSPQESHELLQRDTLNRVVYILVAGSRVAIGIALLSMYLSFTRPLRRLQQGALILASGQFGHTLDVHSRDELGALAATFNQMSAQLERLYRERAQAERLQRELEIARNVQQALFPAQLPQVAGWEIAAVCKPHRETSGDYYDILTSSEGQVGIVVGDVSGKSIPAAMVMVSAHAIIRSEAMDHDSPAVVLNEANRLLCRDVPRGMFVAASYARLDAHQCEMVWANAGQIYPFLLHRVPPPALEEYPFYLTTTGRSLPLGLDPSARYNEQRQPLAPGDTVLFYTDGVVEAMNEGRELYSFERLESLVRSLPSELSPQALIDAVLADVASFVGQAEQHDDITIVAVKLQG